MGYVKTVGQKFSFGHSLEALVYLRFPLAHDSCLISQPDLKQLQNICPFSLFPVRGFFSIKLYSTKLFIIRNGLSRAKYIEDNRDADTNNDKISKQT